MLLAGLSEERNKEKCIISIMVLEARCTFKTAYLLGQRLTVDSDIRSSSKYSNHSILSNILSITKHQRLSTLIPSTPPMLLAELVTITSESSFHICLDISLCGVGTIIIVAIPAVAISQS